MPMRQITVGPPVAELLSELPSQTVVCDALGRVLGFFSPVSTRPRLEDLNLEPPLSVEETEELRKKNRTGTPLEEILARLGH